MSTMSAAAATARGLSPRVDQARRKLGIVLPGEGEAASLLPANKYSKLAMTAAGLSPDGSTKFSFFQSPYAPQTTNVRQPGKLTQSGLFIATGIGFDIQPVADNMLDDDLTAADVAEALRKYLHAGYIRFEKNGRLVLEDFGLFKYPAGGGANIHGGVATTATTTSQAGWVVNNGTPDIRNRHRFDMPIHFTPNDVIDFSVDFGTAIALAGSSTGLIIATVYGNEVIDSDQ